MTEHHPADLTQAEWAAARPWDAYLDAVAEKRDLWLANCRRAAVDPDDTARLADLPGPRRVLVITEDRCGDAARSVPVLAKALAAAPDVAALYLDINEHPSVIERYLTHGGRSVPLAIVQDESGRELGVWGPRPAGLQALFRARQRKLGGVPTEPEEKGRFFRPIMAWYAKDRGRAIVQELLMLLERGGTPR
ncbi:MAG: thioredoxin family protein [Planctomycetota bacterium]|jgi:hypothetical protein